MGRNLKMHTGVDVWMERSREVKFGLKASIFSVIGHKVDLLSKR